MTEITREYFLVCVGHEPVDDDLERCNCPKAGELGHWSCGWNEELQLPQFMVGAIEKAKDGGDE